MYFSVRLLLLRAWFAELRAQRREVGRWFRWSVLLAAWALIWFSRIFCFVYLVVYYRMPPTPVPPLVLSAMAQAWAQNVDPAAALALLFIMPADMHPPALPGPSEEASAT